MNNKNILLIGGLGYIGTVITSHFLRLGYRVNVIDDFIYNNNNSLLPFVGDQNFKFFKGNFQDIKILEKASFEIKNVLILGGLVGDPITKKYPKLSHQINEIGIKSCINFFDNKNINKLVFISTCSNYGLIGDNEFADEEYELKPLSLYAEAKVSAERHLISKKNKVDYCLTILRFATAFGLSPRMRFDLSLNEFVRDLYFGKDLDVFDENTWRPYCHVGDFARLVEIVINSKNSLVNFQTFNSGGEINNFTKKMMVDLILKKIPNGNVNYTSGGGDPRNYKVSFKKVKNVLGFEPMYTVNDGIKELIESFNNGLFRDSLVNKNQYGNYLINLPK